MNLRLPTPHEAACLTSVFEEARYRESSLEELLDKAQRARTGTDRGETVLTGLLARWFLSGESIPIAAAVDAAGEAFVSISLQCGLLEQQAELLVPCMVIAPAQGLLIAGDLHQGEGRRVAEPALAVNAPALALLDYTVRPRGGTVLDLCCGGGILGLRAASWADLVVGVDLSQRAVHFARLNALLNRIDNAEFFEGDAYHPVASRRFDQIVCNPPFIMTPSRRFMFSDTGEELDGFCRSLVEQAPAYLEEGAYFQMICDWAQIAGEDWKERLGGWTEGSGCDAWILSCNVVSPEQYVARHRSVVEMQDSVSQSAWIKHFWDRRVESIHGGFIMLRRRGGDNWTSFSEIRTELTLENGGEHIRRGFLNRDFLHGLKDPLELLASTPRVAPGVSVQQLSRWHDGWKGPELTVCGDRGWRVELPLHKDVLSFVTSLDGSRSVGELARRAQETLGRDLEDVERECCRIVWTLLELGIVDAPESSDERRPSGTS
jgi:methylase of polypeptide subunit release factors